MSYIILDAPAVRQFLLENPVISSGFSVPPVSKFENKEIDWLPLVNLPCSVKSLCRRSPDNLPVLPSHLQPWCRRFCQLLVMAACKEFRLIDTLLFIFIFHYSGFILLWCGNLD
jgi:hypothetical protein